ncbi:MAG: hypothetical protein AAF441_05600 [Pseudomonadota bacterium]
MRVSPLKVHHVLLISFALGLAACARTVGFGGVGEARQNPVIQADLNANGEVACQEWASWVETAYPRYDADRDGSFSELEYNQFISSTGLFAGMPLGSVDTNGDRIYTRTELATFGRQAFDRLDRNDDCNLSGNELVLRSRPRRTYSGGGGLARSRGGSIGGSYTTN